MLNDDLFIRRVCGCLLHTLGNTEAAADYDEDNTDNSKDHEDYQSSMAKLYQQENIVFIAWNIEMGYISVISTNHRHNIQKLILIIPINNSG